MILLFAITFIVQKNSNDFKLLFTSSNDNTVELIINSDENSNYDYNIYTFGGTAKIQIDNKIFDLKEALDKQYITMEKIIEKAMNDEKWLLIKAYTYADGGTRVYQYDDYWIYKENKLSYAENTTRKNVIITRPNVGIDDVYLELEEKIASNWKEDSEAEDVLISEYNPIGISKKMICPYSPEPLSNFDAHRSRDYARNK